MDLMDTDTWTAEDALADALLTEYGVDDELLKETAPGVHEVEMSLTEALDHIRAQARAVLSELREAGFDVVRI